MPARVTGFDNRIEVGNLGEPGVNDYRNPNLAAVMRDLQLVQRFGAGIARARRALRENGSPELAFGVSAERVRAVLVARGEFGRWGVLQYGGNGPKAIDGTEVKLRA